MTHAEDIQKQELYTNQAGSSETTQAKMMEIHSALSNCDSIRIFNLAATGIDASTSVLQKHQFTKKRYYGRLKELVDLGLIFKNNGEYKHTALGSAIFENQVKNLEQILQVSKTNSIHSNQLGNEQEQGAGSNDEKVISQEISKDIEATAGTGRLKPLNFFVSWNELSSEVALITENAKFEIYGATRYVDFRTAETAISAANRGCKVNILHSSRNGLSPKLQVVGNLMAHPKALSVYKEFTTNPNIFVAEVEQLPYSFVVIDGTKVGIEIVNPEDPYTFFFGLEFENRTFASKLISHFKEIARTAGKDTIASLMESEQGMLAKQPQRRDAHI